MFAAVISRDNGCPWGETGMTTARWVTEVPVRWVQIRDLVATQPGILLHALIGDPPAPVGGDRYPHVIAWRGTLYLEDGHHRVIRTALKGCGMVRARVLEVPDAGHGV